MKAFEEISYKRIVSKFSKWLILTSYSRCTDMKPNALAFSYETNPVSQMCDQLRINAHQYLPTLTEKIFLLDEYQ